MKTLLNLGAGKIDINSSRYQSYTHVVHVDRYFDEKNSKTISQTEEYISHANLSGINASNPTTSCACCKSDIFEFLDTFRYKFDDVISERIFEHMEYVGGEIGRLIEAINMITLPHATLTIVVPNAIKLSKMILDYEDNAENMSIKDQLNTKLIINSELQNCKCDPHASTWSPRLAREYIESEGSWVIDSIDENYHFANRDIYMKIVCKKPKENK